MVQYLFIYSPDDFIGGLPGEQGAQAAGSPIFTLTLKAGATPTLVAVNDNDNIFDEVDGTQSLAQTVTIDGDTYTAGTTINTAYDLINTATGHKVTSLHFGGDGFQQGAVDGLVSTIELVPGTSYSFNRERTSHQQNNLYGEYFACYAAGARIDTPDGPRLIEDLRPGDVIWTGDGPDRLMWCGSKTVAAQGAMAPVLLPRGLFGLTRDLVVSQQHRMLVAGERVELIAGCDAAFLPAIALVRAGLARLRPGGTVTYHHLMCDGHRVIRANGALSETLLPARHLDLMGAEAAAEIRALFPDLGRIGRIGTALPCLRAHEAAVVLAA